MAWQRSIPFGYCMEKAVIRCNTQEADAVRQIFSLYLKGLTPGQITEMMNDSGLRYRKEAEQWDKNMIYRILSNHRYTGDATYPPIISESEFQLVQERKAKQSLYSPCPPWIAAVKGRAICNVCGETVSRQSVGRGRTQWQCQNPYCQNTVRYNNLDLERRLERCVQAIAKDPELLASRSSEQQKTTPPILRMENELTAAFNRRDGNSDYLKALIFAIASEKYLLLPDNTLVFRIKDYIRQMDEGADQTSIIKKILDAVVAAVVIGDRHSISLQLVNGLIITDEGDVK